MLGGANTETNQTPKTINLPDETEGVENPPPSGHAEDEPEQKPQKGKTKGYPILIKIE